MIHNFLISSTFWALEGMPIASNEIIDYRLSVCTPCEFWNSKSFGGTGKCTKCGCSTWAKLRMVTERCPIGKWEAIKQEDINEEQKLH
jgi:hypothetical protein